ncbi:MAG TPA: acyl-CoA dehydrogenase family protein, partial [Myxococcales bacterium]|nr:acyl-CoA dehydrogenase family protein [Myxococcales bacterium]
MDFSLSDQQRALQQAARTFARERIRPRAAEYDEKSHFPRELLAEAMDAGLINLNVPESLGGVGLSHLDQAIVVEELAWGCAGV